MKICRRNCRKLSLLFPLIASSWSSIVILLANSTTFCQCPMKEGPRKLPSLNPDATPLRLYHPARHLCHRRKFSNTQPPLAAELAKCTGRCSESHQEVVHFPPVLRSNVYLTRKILEAMARCLQDIFPR